MLSRDDGVGLIGGLREEGGVAGLKESRTLERGTEGSEVG